MSARRYHLALSVEELQELFADSPDKMFVGMKGGMLEELVRMLYFDYAIDIEVCPPRPTGTKPPFPRSTPCPVGRVWRG